MARRTSNREQLQYEEIQNRKKRELQRRREIERRRAAGRESSYNDGYDDSYDDRFEPEPRPKRRKAPREPYEILEARRKQEERERLERERAERYYQQRSGRRNSRYDDDYDDYEGYGSRDSYGGSGSGYGYYRKSRFGMFLLGIQVIASIIFMASLLLLNLLPWTYLLGILGVLAVFALIVYMTQRRPKKKGTGGKIFSIFLTVLLLVASFYIAKTNELLGNVFAGNEENGSTVTEPFNVYISGIDVYGDVSQESRSDVNIIATVNPKTNQILLTSTPRDFYVTIPNVSEGEYDKLTHAGIYGVDASMATLANLYGTEIDFYARLNFTSLINVVEALGGINVYSEYSFTTSEDSGCVFDVTEGYNQLNGEQALAFARERQNVPGGDDQRGKDQQAVITAMIKKMLSPMMLLKANGMIDSLDGNIQTSMSMKQMRTLIKKQLLGNAKWSITSVEPTGYYDSRYCYSAPGEPLSVTIPDDESVAYVSSQIQAVINGEIPDGAETLNE